MFRINNNLSALSAYQSLNATTTDFEKSVRRLSRGLRIVDAADDLTGLISSEAFRAQIASLDAAMSATSVSVNYAKTAENAMSELSSLLSEARGLAVASANGSTLSAAQISANQDQLSSIVASIDRIASTTNFGGRNLLDGSAGVTTQISNAAKVSGISFGGTSGSSTVTLNGLITINQTAAATHALYTATATLSTGALQTGSFSLNGTSFTVTAGTSGSVIASQVNAAAAQTGVTASFDSGTNQLTFSSSTTGSNAEITFSDGAGVLSSAGNTNALATGSNATAQVNFGTGSVLYTGGQAGSDGLTLTDANGNRIVLTEAGNAVGSYVAGSVIAADATFQIGANAGETASLSLRNMSASQLGTGIISGLTLANLNLSNAGSAGEAMQVIDQALNEVSQSRGRVGNFQRYALESNERTLRSARENVAASESSIRDLDMASELVNFTRLGLLQNSGLLMLRSAQQSHQAVIRLLDSSK